MPILAHLHALVTILCPSWCSRCLDHTTDLHRAARLHLHTHRIPGNCGGQEITLRRGDHVDRHGQVTSEPPRVVLNGADVLDVAQARELIAGLTLAVELATDGAL